MNPNDYWQEYIGNETPVEFLKRIGCREPEAALDEYMTRLPRVFGIALRRSWTRTFQQEDQINWQIVRSGLSAFLDETRASWEAEVAELPEKPRPLPKPVYVPVEPPVEPPVDTESDLDADPMDFVPPLETEQHEAPEEILPEPSTEEVPSALQS